MMSFFQAILNSNNLQPIGETQDFFLIGGQSNVGTNSNSIDVTPTGRVPYSLIPSELTGTQPYTVWDGTDFNLFTHTSSNDYGWINHFLKEVADSGKTFGFYKWGQGGRQLSLDGPFTSYTRSTLKNNGLAAWNYFKSNNPNPRIIFLWCQGYTDGLDLTNALNYGAHEASNPNHSTGGNLGAWFSEVRSHFTEPNMKIIYNTLSNNATGSTYRAEVKLGQEYVSTLSPYNVLVNADDLQFLDTAHFGATGVIGLADRFLTQYNTL